MENTIRGNTLAIDVVTIESQTNHLCIGGQVCGTHIGIALGEVESGYQILRLEHHETKILSCLFILIGSPDLLGALRVHGQSKQQGVVSRLLNVRCSYMHRGIGHANASQQHHKNRK